MSNEAGITREILEDVRTFLDQTSDSNEDTEYDTSKEYLIDVLKQLVKRNGNISIVEDFETPFIHPMITVQKWVEELKILVNEQLAEL